MFLCLPVFYTSNPIVQFQYINDRMGRAKDVLASYRVELRQVLKDVGKGTFAEYDGKGKVHKYVPARCTKLSFLGFSECATERLPPSTRLDSDAISASNFLCPPAFFPAGTYSCVLAVLHLSCGLCFTARISTNLPQR